jgi:hypothetical protein
MLWQSFTIDRDLLEVEKSMYQNSIMDESNPWAKTAADVVDEIFQDGLLYEAATILASIRAMSCTAESGLRRVKTYLRLTMGEERLNSIAVINIERAYANPTIKNDMVKIIDTFGRRNGRDSYFF